MDLTKVEAWELATKLKMAADNAHELDMSIEQFEQEDKIKTGKVKII